MVPRGTRQLVGLDARHPLLIPRPIPLTPHGAVNGRATRAVLALGVAVRAPLRLRLDAGHLPGCPPAFSELGAGLCPRSATGAWALLSPFRAGLRLRLPLQRADPVGWVLLAGQRLDALPHAYCAASLSCNTENHLAAQRSFVET